MRLRSLNRPAVYTSALRCCGKSTTPACSKRGSLTRLVPMTNGSVTGEDVLSRAVVSFPSVMMRSIVVISCPVEGTVYVRIIGPFEIVDAPDWAGDYLLMQRELYCDAPLNPSVSPTRTSNPTLPGGSYLGRTARADQRSETSEPGVGRVF